MMSTMIVMRAQRSLIQSKAVRSVPAVYAAV